MILGLAAAFLLYGLAVGGDKAKIAKTTIDLGKVTAKDSAAIPVEEPQQTAETRSGEEINWQVISSGGADGTSTNYAHEGTVAQTAVGGGSSSNYVLNHGYWQEFAGAQWLCGDVNNDGYWNVSDGAALWNYLCDGEPVPVYLEACDADDCGTTNISDIAYMFAYVFVPGWPEPCEGIVCEVPTGGNSVDLGVPVTGAPGSTVYMPIYVTSDTQLRAVSVGFSYDSEDIEVTAIGLGTISWEFNFWAEVDETSNTVSIAGCVMANPIAAQSGGLLATLEIEISPTAENGSVDFDSVFFDPIGEFVFAAGDGGTIAPAYNDNGTDDLIIQESSYICGDATGSGDVDIDDVVHLIAYIFSGGPAPVPYESGDADCSETVDIDDVVWLIGYIFSGGNIPCDTDGDGEPDC